MPENALCLYPKFSFQKTFTSDSWRLQRIKLHHPELLQVACQKNLTIQSAPQWFHPAHHRVFNANTDSLEDLDAFRYLEHVEIIADSVSQSPPPSLRRTKTYPGTSTPLSDYIAVPWESKANGWLEINLQNNPYHPFAMLEEYKYIPCGLTKNGMETYYDYGLREENTTLNFRSLKNEDSIDKLVAAMPDDEALGEWKLHIFK